MSLLGWIVAGSLAAIATSLCKKEKKEIVYVERTRPSYSSNQDSDMQRVSAFLQEYNNLKIVCDNVFGVDNYNAIKKLASSIKFNTARDDAEAQKVVGCLYDIVDFRNRFLGHNVFGIGAIPVRQYIEFMRIMRNNLSENKDVYRLGYRKFLEYKQRRLSYSGY